MLSNYSEGLRLEHVEACYLGSTDKATILSMAAAILGDAELVDVHADTFIIARPANAEHRPLQVLGFLAYGGLLVDGQNRKSLRIMGLATQEHARSKGIGRSMVAHLVDVADKNLIDLHVTSSPEAVKLYENFGFRLDDSGSSNLVRFVE